MAPALPRRPLWVYAALPDRWTRREPLEARHQRTPGPGAATGRPVLLPAVRASESSGTEWRGGRNPGLGTYQLLGAGAWPVSAVTASSVSLAKRCSLLLASRSARGPTALGADASRPGPCCSSASDWAQAASKAVSTRLRARKGPRRGRGTGACFEVAAEDRGLLPAEAESPADRAGSGPVPLGLKITGRQAVHWRLCQRRQCSAYGFPGGLPPKSMHRPVRPALAQNCDCQKAGSIGFAPRRNTVGLQPRGQSPPAQQ